MTHPDLLIHLTGNHFQFRYKSPVHLVLVDMLYVSAVFSSLLNIIRKTECFLFATWCHMV